MRSYDTIEKLQDRLSPAYCIENFLTDLELGKLYELWTSTQAHAIEKNTGPITVNFKDIKDSDIIKIVIQKIKNEIGEDCECWGGQFFYTDRPYVVHNDDDMHNFPDAYKAFSMPIKVWPEDKESSLTELVCFEQSYFEIIPVD